MRFFVKTLVISLICLVKSDFLFSQEKSANQLIEALTLRNDKIRQEQSGMVSCGQINADRENASALAQLGEKVVPALKNEIISSKLIYGRHWLLLTYAKILKVNAIPELERIEGTGINVDIPLALSLGITSYVSESRRLSRPISCFRTSEPRDTLDHIILGLEKNNYKWLEGGLGPVSRAMGKEMLTDNSWNAIESSLRRSSQNAKVSYAVGYQFINTSKVWSQPPDTLDTSDPIHVSDGTYFAIDTEFKNRKGIECGRMKVEFIKMLDREASTDTYNWLSYRINNADIKQLLKVLASCAMSQ